MLRQLYSMQLNKKIFKETCVIVFTGLIINYPLSILITWLLISVFDITHPLAFATLSTFIFTVVALCRVYIIRINQESSKEL
jgi:hypothetical protein